MKILLILPPIDINAHEAYAVTPPLGLAYLAATAEQEGHEVKILDCIIEGIDQKTNSGDGFVKIGLTSTEIASRVRDYSPDLVGISCPFSLMDKEMRSIAALAKEVNKDTKVVVGGAHPSCMTDIVISDHNIDFVVVGEGEKTFAQLLSVLSQNSDLNQVKGLIWKMGGKIIENERRDFIKNLDSLPFPAWHMFALEKYITLSQVHGSQKRKRYIPMTTSRGCPGRCIFCSIHAVWGHQWRQRSPENVVEEIKQLVSKYGITEIHFEDDNLTLSKLRIEKICDLIVEQHLDITWTTPNGVAVGTLDEEMLKKMKQSGCYQLNFGIESGDPYVQKNIIGKPINLEKLKKIIKYSKKIGIWTHGFFVIGFPGESEANIRLTAEFAKKSDLDSANFFIATPYPQTPLYYLALSQGFIDCQDPSKLRTMSATMNTQFFKAEEIHNLQKNLYLEFINYRIKREFLEGYGLVRLSKLRSRDDVSFLFQRVGRVVRFVK